eukprot:GHVR01157042.1.p1 GENE.GHVR01157042.1~~GHVR01157042.1.p1  ORF type:complete len:399 (+),score=75.13 GHVR01157042.1:695-1891(+)
MDKHKCDMNMWDEEKGPPKSIETYDNILSCSYNACMEANVEKLLEDLLKYVKFVDKPFTMNSGDISNFIFKAYSYGVSPFYHLTAINSGVLLVQPIRESHTLNVEMLSGRKIVRVERRELMADLLIAMEGKGDLEDEFRTPYQIRAHNVMKLESSIMSLLPSDSDMDIYPYKPPVDLSEFWDTMMTDLKYFGGDDTADFLLYFESKALYRLDRVLQTSTVDAIRDYIKLFLIYKHILPLIGLKKTTRHDKRQKWQSCLEPVEWLFARHYVNERNPIHDKYIKEWVDTFNKGLLEEIKKKANGPRYSKCDGISQFIIDKATDALTTQNVSLYPDWLSSIDETDIVYRTMYGEPDKNLSKIMNKGYLKTAIYLNQRKVCMCVCVSVCGVISGFCEPLDSV